MSVLGLLLRMQAPVSRCLLRAPCHYHFSNVSANPNMQLVIKAHVEAAETTLNLHVHSSDTVETVKAKIQEKAGYSADKQFLVLGVRLEDGQTLADYNIKPDTVLHMRLKSQEAPATQEVPQQGGSK